MSSTYLTQLLTLTTMELNKSDVLSEEALYFCEKPELFKGCCYLKSESKCSNKKRCPFKIKKNL